MSRQTIALSLLLAAALSCGTEPDQQQSSTLTGVVKDYALGGRLAGASVSILELPGATTTADSNGGFTFKQLTPGNSVRVLVSTTNYPETTNQITFLGARTVNVSAFGASVVFIGSQYAEAGVNRIPRDAMVVARLEDDLGNPRTGLAPSDITLLDQNQTLSGTGPFIFGANGNVDTTLSVTTVFSGRSRIAFLNVLHGNYTLRVVDGADTLLRPLVARDSGVTLVVR